MLFLLQEIEREDARRSTIAYADRILAESKAIDKTIAKYHRQRRAADRRYAAFLAATGRV